MGSKIYSDKDIELVKKKLEILDKNKILFEKIGNGFFDFRKDLIGFLVENYLNNKLGLTLSQNFNKISYETTDNNYKTNSKGQIENLIAGDMNNYSFLLIRYYQDGTGCEIQNIDKIDRAKTHTQEKELLLRLQFCCGPLGFNWSEKAPGLFDKFYNELLNFNPTYTDNINRGLYWKLDGSEKDLENARKVIENYNSLVEKYENIYEKKKEKYEIEKLEKELKRLKKEKNA